MIISVVRKPFSQTALDNIKLFKTGCLCIDRCRIYFKNETSPTAKRRKSNKPPSSLVVFGKDSRTLEKFKVIQSQGELNGRWPANVLLSENVVEIINDQSGVLTSGKPSGIRKTASNMLKGGGNHHPLTGYHDSGGASRFFRVIK